MKRKIVITLAGGIFILSLFFLIFATYQIVKSSSDTRQALQEWERKKVKPSAIHASLDEPVAENPVSVVNPDILKHKPEDRQQNGTTSADDEDTPAPQTEEPEYTSAPQKGEVIGKMTIPRLNRQLPIIEGTGQAELRKGVGHYIGSVLPGIKNNSVLAGHRDSVFRGLGELEIGDTVTVETEAGTFTYRIQKQQIVEKDDLSVVQPDDEPILTLITCYPFNYVGNAPKRYILTAKLDPEDENNE